MLIQGLNRAPYWLSLAVDLVAFSSETNGSQLEFEVDHWPLSGAVFRISEGIFMFPVIFFEVDHLELFEVVVFFHVAAVATRVAPSGDLVFLLELVGPESRSLKSSLDGIPDLFLFLGERGHFGLLFSHLVGVFAAAGLG